MMTKRVKYNMKTEMLPIDCKDSLQNDPLYMSSAHCTLTHWRSQNEDKLLRQLALR